MFVSEENWKIIYFPLKELYLSKTEQEDISDAESPFPRTHES